MGLNGYLGISVFCILDIRYIVDRNYWKTHTGCIQILAKKGTPMKERDILTEEEGGILRIILNRPRVRNALTTSMMDEITSYLETRENSPALRVVIFSGAGGSFCSGSDFRQIQPDQGVEKIRQHLKAIADMYKALRKTSKFLIAEVHGNALGGGLALALACDWIIASVDARFGLPEMKLGFLPALALVPLAHRIRERALELMMTGEILEAGQAQALGLVSQVLREDQISSRVGDLARLLVLGDPDSSAMAKRVCRTLLSMDYEQGVDYAASVILSRLCGEEMTGGK
jgi:methylglutaconyl-CoA hydratase